MTASPVTFGEWLQQRRKQLGLTQAGLASRAACSAVALRKIESGERRPSRELAVMLAQALNLPPEQHTTFVRVARGELNLERLTPSPAETEKNPTPLRPRLPVPLTALLGRERELATIQELLMGAQCRALTLTGPGGIGKTRLSLEAAHTLQAEFKDGGVFVALAGASSTADLVSTVANSISAAWRGNAPLAQQLLSYLQDKSLLLTLDNLEHLLAEPETANFVAELLRAAPHVKILATSREPLRLPGEWVLEVQGLPMPANAAEPNSAMALFMERVQQIQVGHTFSETDLAAIARICQLVDGWPLSLELAAAWSQTLSCAEIAQELERSAEVLSVPNRALAARHQSLRAVFEHSWKLLTPAEQSVFARLAVFRGGFTRVGAEAVAHATLHTLSALVQKSLVRRTLSERFEIHERLRQYAAEQLLDEAAVRDEHARYYLGLWHNHAAWLRDERQRDGMRLLSAEVDNFRAAWTRAAQRGLFAELEGAAWATYALYEAHGWFSEGQALFAALATAQPPEILLGRALTYQGWFAMRLAQFPAARELFEQARPLLLDLNAQENILFNGILFYVLGQTEKAQAYLEQARQMARAKQDRWLEAQALINQQGLLGAHSGKWAEAYAGITEALEILRALGDERTRLTAVTFYLATVALALGRHAELQVMLEEALAMHLAYDDAWGVGLTYVNLGRVRLARGELDEARRLMRDGLILLTKLGAQADMAFAHLHLGHVEAAAQAWAGAELQYTRALSLAQAVHSQPTVIEAQQALHRLKSVPDHTKLVDDF